MIRHLTSAEQRAAQAALNGSGNDLDLDRYLIIDDTDDVHSEIVTVLRERSPRMLEVLS